MEKLPPSPQIPPSIPSQPMGPTAKTVPKEQGKYSIKTAGSNTIFSKIATIFHQRATQKTMPQTPRQQENRKPPPGYCYTLKGDLSPLPPAPKGCRYRDDGRLEFIPSRPEGQKENDASFNPTLKPPERQDAHPTYVNKEPPPTPHGPSQNIKHIAPNKQVQDSTSAPPETPHGPSTLPTPRPVETPRVQSKPLTELNHPVVQPQLNGVPKHPTSATEPQVQSEPK